MLRSSHASMKWTSRLLLRLDDVGTAVFCLIVVVTVIVGAVAAAAASKGGFLSFAHQSSSKVTMATLPVLTARCSGVLPPAVVCRTFAPRSSSALLVVTSPRWTQWCSKVSPLRSGRSNFAPERTRRRAMSILPSEMAV